MKHVAMLVLILAAGTSLAQDSPLVAAAKSRKNAKTKSRVYITNATLSKSGGHISTTASQAPIALAKAPSPKAEEPKPQAKVAESEKKTETKETPDIDDPEMRMMLKYDPEALIDDSLPPVVILSKNLKLVEPQKSQNLRPPQ